MNQEKIQRRLSRLIEMKDKLESEHSGKEEKFTYHGGFDLGYLKGKIAVLEEINDAFENLEIFEQKIKTK